MREISFTLIVCAAVFLEGCATAREFGNAADQTVQSLRQRLFGSQLQSSPEPQVTAEPASSTPAMKNVAEDSTVITGSVRPDEVIDGDTIDIAGHRIRLYGIDAPEADQQCAVRGRTLSCGAQARYALIGFLDGTTVHCVRKDTDRYGRNVSVCLADGYDVSAGMVRAGLAVAYRKYALDYVNDEETAKLSRRGMWAGTFEMPWDWRARKRQ